MKINIGNYKQRIGPYHIADFLEYFAILERDRDWLGEWLSTTWVDKFCTWIYSKRERKIDVKIDYWDVWDADTTLAIIILPILKRLRKTKHGTPLVEPSDVPEHLRGNLMNEYGVDEFHFKRFDWILDEMIWTFEQLQPDYNWENQYWSIRPEFDSSKSSTKTYGKCDWDGMALHQDRISNGLRLFGVYFQTLWD